MKTLFTIVAVLILQITNAQNLSKSGNQWNIRAGSFSPSLYTTYSLKIGQDTSVNGFTYKVILQNSSLIAEIWYSSGQLLREENQKVYLKNPDVPEILLYDFSLEQGDKFYGVFCEMEVLSTDTVTLVNGDRRKRLRLLAGGVDNIETFWIEGIGSADFGLTSHLFICGTDYAESLLCFYENNDVNFPEADAECVLLKIKELNEIAVNVFPNPASSSFTIKNTSGLFKTYSITDVSGKIYHSGGLETGEVNVYSAMLNPGFYTLILTDTSGQRYSKRLIII